MNDRASTILRFWFGEPGDDLAALGKRWFKKDPAFDDEIRSAFLDDIERAARGELDPWVESAPGTLALVVLLDQFPRNVFRDSPRSLTADERALTASLEAQVRGLDRELSFVERCVLLIPMMHAEDREVQRRGLEAFGRLAADAAAGGAPEGVQKMVGTALNYAEAHARIVERFGRFPHRNVLLGRASTAEEIDFLKEPGSRF
jgi:uncharacterized protein (DUF924 family)